MKLTFFQNIFLRMVPHIPKNTIQFAINVFGNYLIFTKYRLILSENQKFEAVRTEATI